MKSRKRSKKRIIKKSDRLKWILAAAAAALFAAVMIIGIVRTNHKNTELETRKARLEQLIEEEQQRRTELEDEAVYVQTRKYIEEKAKSIGYVYPDEIIFREDD